jgi:membrane carboxypeptidase/penicillin-binding protein
MWFVGATPELTTAIYVGRDDGNPMGSHGFASKTAFPIWLNLYRSIHFYKKRFYIDPTLREIPIDWITGERSSIKPEEDEQMRVITLLQ